MNVIELTNGKAKAYFLERNRYFNSDLPGYISFEPILNEVDKILMDTKLESLIHGKNKPDTYDRVNYHLLSNKDGRFAWRPLELMHPAIYVALVHKICDSKNWNFLKQRFLEFDSGVVDCCSISIIPEKNQTNSGAQIINWWLEVEQKSLKYSLEYSHMLQTDIVDCYGTLYTHSIPWAIHGLDVAKKNKKDELFGNTIDKYIRYGRYGQTNGISQGSALMDFIAEIVLGYVDLEIKKEVSNTNKLNNGDFRILRYRDDYRIFANSDEEVEGILQIISKKLISVGMKLGVSKTHLSRNVVQGSIKQDKLIAINLQDLGETNAKTIQKQLLRLHSFGQQYPNSGALRRLVSDFFKTIEKIEEAPNDLEVLVAIATDIGFVSPSSFAPTAGILSHLIKLEGNTNQKSELWKKVLTKMRKMPYNGYNEIWLQRIIQFSGLDEEFQSNESICQVVNGQSVDIWENKWVSCKKLKSALRSSKIFDKSKARKTNNVMHPNEIPLFDTHFHSG